MNYCCLHTTLPQGIFNSIQPGIKPKIEDLQSINRNQLRCLVNVKHRPETPVSAKSRIEKRLYFCSNERTERSYSTRSSKICVCGAESRRTGGHPDSPSVPLGHVTRPGRIPGTPRNSPKQRESGPRLQPARGHDSRLPPPPPALSSRRALQHLHGAGHTGDGCAQKSPIPPSSRIPVADIGSRDCAPTGGKRGWA